jgi:hypothetical protein
MDLLQEIFAPDFVAHLPNGDLPGLEPLRAYLTAFRAVFPDARYAIEEEIVRGGERRRAMEVGRDPRWPVPGDRADGQAGLADRDDALPGIGQQDR